MVWNCVDTKWGKFWKTGCDMGVKIKMTETVCGMGGFPAQKACVLQQYLLKILEMCGMGVLSACYSTLQLRRPPSPGMPLLMLL